MSPYFFIACGLFWLIVLIWLFPKGVLSKTRLIWFSAFVVILTGVAAYYFTSFDMKRFSNLFLKFAISCLTGIIFNLPLYVWTGALIWSKKTVYIFVTDYLQAFWITILTWFLWACGLSMLLRKLAFLAI
jgi:hypothetical protein